MRTEKVLKIPPKIAGTIHSVETLAWTISLHIKQTEMNFRRNTDANTSHFAVPRIPRKNSKC